MNSLVPHGHQSYRHEVMVIARRRDGGEINIVGKEVSARVRVHR